MIASMFSDVSWGSIGVSSITIVPFALGGVSASVSVSLSCTTSISSLSSTRFLTGLGSLFSLEAACAC